jgi:hypothetical protein
VSRRQRELPKPIDGCEAFAVHGSHSSGTGVKG